MLKHRQDGLVALHGMLLMLLVVGLFLGALLAVQGLDLIRFNMDVNWGIYGSGIVVAMLWIHHNLGGVGERLGVLTAKEALRLTVQQVVRLVAVLFTLVFLLQDVGMSRSFLGGFLALAGAILFGANFWLARELATAFFQRQRLRTLVVASREEARLLDVWLGTRRHLGIDVIGYATPDTEGGEGDARFLGTLRNLPDVVARHAVDQLVFARDAFPRAVLAEVVRVAERAHCRVRFFVNLQEVLGTAPGSVETSGHYAFTTLTPEPLANPCNRLLKRALDIVVALPVVLVVLPPLTVAVWVMQARQSPGPVFYGQMRSGLNRERFKIFKFRTMHVDQGENTAVQARLGDERVYPFGRWLRRTSLDEMPQFWNVILGSMSVSGPRPHMLEHDVEFALIEHAYFKRHYVKPGITGLAQSKGFRGELRESVDLANRVHYDAAYVTGWTLGLDVSILLNTVRQVVAPPTTAY